MRCLPLCRSRSPAHPSPLQQMHPLLRNLLDSRAAPPPNLALFERKTPSIAWVTESAEARLPKAKDAKLDPVEEAGESDDEYDVSWRS